MLDLMQAQCIQMYQEEQAVTQLLHLGLWYMEDQRHMCQVELPNIKQLEVLLILELAK